MTPRQRILVNALIEANSDAPASVVRILRIDRETRRIAVIDVADPSAFPTWLEIADLEQGLQDGTLSIREDDPWAADSRPDQLHSAASLRIRDYRYDVISALVEGERAVDLLDRHKRSELVKAAVAARGAAADNIYNWLRLWWKRGQTKNALLSNFGNSGRRLDGQPKAIGAKRGRPSKLSRLHPELVGMNVTAEDRANIEAGLKRYFLNRHNGRALTFPEAYDLILKDYYRTRLELRRGHLIPVYNDSPESVNRLPTEAQVRYYAELLRNDEARLKTLFGEREFNLKHRSVLNNSTHMSSGPGDLFLIDATVADLYILSTLDRRYVIGRPIIYLVVDHWSGMIVGLYIGLEGPNWTGAMMALENAFTEKVSFCARYGVEADEHFWPCDISPRTILADRGEFIGATADWLVPGFNLVVENTASWRADWKSLVEGQFKITRERGLKRVPGLVEKLKRRGGKDYRYDAKLTLPQFYRFMIELIWDYNHRHRLAPARIPAGFLMSDPMDVRPNDLWSWGFANLLGIGRTYDRKDVQVNLLPSYPARTSYQGLSVKSGLLCYSFPSLAAEGLFLRNSGRASQVFNIAIDPRDVTYAYRRLDGGRTIETGELTPAHRKLLAGLNMAEVEDRKDRFDIGALLDRPQRLQDRGERNARLDAIVETAEQELSDALAVGERVNVTSIRGARRLENRVKQQKDAFRPEASGSERPLPDVDADDDGPTPIPF